MGLLIFICLVLIAGFIGCARTGGDGAACESVGDTPAFPFVDATAALGVDFFHKSAKHSSPAGGCVFDFDGDGDLDLYFRDTLSRPNRLYRNEGASFTEVTEEAGAGHEGEGLGCVAFDVEGDGDLDVYLLNKGPDGLLRNDGGKFVDISVEAGISTDGSPGNEAGSLTRAVSAGDLDGDGDLDLVVGRYLDPTQNGFKCMQFPAECVTLRNLIFINEGGMFTEEGVQRGIDVEDPTQASALYDIDHDGDLDLFIGNDFGFIYPNRLYINDGTGHFLEEAEQVNLAWDGDESIALPGFTMGVTLGDYNLDGVLDMALSEHDGQVIALYQCADGPSCEDVGLSVGLDASIPSVSWGLGLVDFNQDGWLDLFIGNGRMSEVPAEQHNQLFWNMEGTFEEYLPSEEDAAFAVVENSRGVVFGDLDGDADVDVIVSSLGAGPQILLNQSPVGHGLLVELDTLSAGASVTVTAGGITRTQPVLVGDSFLGSSDPRVHFGLGDACFADVKVRWLDGTEAERLNVLANRVVRIERP